MTVRACWYKGYRNVGDAIIEPIMDHFGYELSYVEKTAQHKFIGIGSIMSWLQDGDTVWGTGCMTPKPIRKSNVNFLATRGPLTASQISGSKVPDVYGDPGLLLPLIYDPDIQPTNPVGYLPHYVDRWPLQQEGLPVIDIEDDWKSIVRQIKACEKIITSSLHGIVLCEAYGIPVEWVTYSNKILGGTFKFQDYFLGTNRREQDFGTPDPLEDLEEIQINLITALSQLPKASCVV